MNDAVTAAPVLRTFAEFGLLRMLGRSSLTIAWLATDLRTGQPVRLLASTYPVASQALRERCVEDAKRAARLVPDEYVAATALIGSAEHVRERIEAFTEAGVTMLNAIPAGATRQERIEQLLRLREITTTIDRSR